ncbi:hypothetical protein [Tahibacter caeni]|uniref:hypothetical protein n=1 Tax=Tahibacter caeni TaxID=1453545 RepID=UPI0021477163|nr:hypothetical protein [Tahibacter caeni]
MTDVSMYDVGFHEQTYVIGTVDQDATAAPDSANCAEPANIPPLPLSRNEAARKVPASNKQPTHLIHRYAFITDSEEGLIITDIDTLADGEFRNNFPGPCDYVERQRRAYKMFNVGGKLNDANGFVVGTTNASLFAYVADDKNRLKITQLTSHSAAGVLRVLPRCEAAADRMAGDGEAGIVAIVPAGA